MNAPSTITGPSSLRSVAIAPPKGRVVFGNGSYSEVETVTPEYAMELLRYNTNNRSLRKAKVDQIARDILEGRWNPETATIKMFVVDDGPIILADGQNRLSAIIKSGVAVEAQLTWKHGAMEEFFAYMATIDDNAVRTMNNIFQIEGASTDHFASQSASCVIALDFHRGKLKAADLTMSNRAKRDYVRRQPALFAELQRAAAEWKSENGYRCLQHWLTGYAMIWEVSPVKARDFWSFVARHNGFADAMPEKYLYELIAQRNGFTKVSGPRQNAVEYFRAAHILVKCWNAHCKGTPVRIVRLDREFPRPLRHPEEPNERSILI